MEIFTIRLIETLATVVGFIIIYFITENQISSTLKQAHLNRARRKGIVKAIHLFTTITSFVLLGAIWGVDQNEIAVFVGSILTVLGIAFFAQWSLLSNITASIILFFNHPIKIGDTIKVLDKEVEVEGEVLDFTYFFVHIKASTGETMTVPNSLLLQKSILIIKKSEELKEHSKS
jgi:small-conductance mechanosensitive channel